jgi:hypothetical protein
MLKLLIYMSCIVNRLITRDTNFVYIKSYLLLIKFFFIFNIHLYFINESNV